MIVKSNAQSIDTYSDAYRAGKIRVNKGYQRQPGVWKTAARSYLVESIIHGFPMPALYLHERFDSARKPYRDIIDGQQRTVTIMDFQAGKFRLSRSLNTKRLRGLSFEELEDEDVQQFYSYSLPIFQMVGATDAQVREAFRRLNSHNVVLNPEEKRHAKHQSDFKLLMDGLASDLSAALTALGIFSERQILRMKDVGFIAEVLYIYRRGLATTKSSDIDRFYTQIEKESFDFQDFADRLRTAVSVLLDWEWFSNSVLSKSHHALLVVAATMHTQATLPGVQLDLARSGGRGVADNASDSLELVAEFLDEPEVKTATKANELPSGQEELWPIVRASRSGTNVKAGREARFRVYFDAISA